MKRHLRTIALVVGAIALTVFAVRPADAGNYVNANQKYYEVTLELDQYFLDNPASSWVLIDDITYSAQYTPCDPSSACDYFSEDDIMDKMNTYQGPITSQMQFTDVNGTTTTTSTTWGGTSGYIEYVVSKSHFSEIRLLDAQAGLEGESIVVDACSWSTYGQIALREYQAAHGFKEFFVKTAAIFADERGNSYAAGAGGDALAIASAMPMTLAMVSTSQSRHFQTPHIVQFGNVYFQVSAGASGISNAKAYVKGRTISRLDPNVPLLDPQIEVHDP
jgi:hypothetical protein